MDLFWTEDKPTEPGQYWQGKWNGTSVGIVPVRYYADELCIGNWPIPDRCEWAGPIPLPKRKPIKRVMPPSKPKIERIRVVPTLLDKIRITPDGDEVYAQCMAEDCGWRGPISECDIGTEQDGWENPVYEIPICPMCSEPVDY